MTGKMSALAANMQEVFVGIMNSHVCDQKRRELPCILTVTVTNADGLYLDSFETFVEKPTDHLEEDRFGLGSDRDIACVADALANLGIEEQLKRTEAMLGEHTIVRLRVSRAFADYPKRPAAIHDIEVDRSADVQQ